MILECVVDIGGAGGDTTVLPAAHTQPSNTDIEDIEQEEACKIC